jgi:3D (Asp-Asp-Asp) domain-containing protein
MNRMPKFMLIAIILLVVCATLFVANKQKDATIAKAYESSQAYSEEYVKAKRTIEILNGKIAELEDMTEELRKEIENLQKANGELRQLRAELDTRREKSVKIASVDSGVKKIEDFELTWYNYNSGYTFTGVPPEDNHTIAVDPNVIPLGVWVIIEMPDGTLKKRRTEDIGSAVQNRVIDEYDPASTEELMRRGRTHGVTVYIIGE